MYHVRVICDLSKARTLWLHFDGAFKTGAIRSKMAILTYMAR